MAGCDEAARRVRFLAPVLALTVLSAACGSAATSGAEGSGGAAREFDRPVRWESGLWEDLGRSLTIVFTGGPEGNLEQDPCAGEYDVEVDETADSVTVTVYSLKLVEPPGSPDEIFCFADGYARTLSITIGGSGLGERALIDGARGETRSPIDETALMAPASLPEGWSELRRYPLGSAMVRDYGSGPASPDADVQVPAGRVLKGEDRRTACRRKSAKRPGCRQVAPPPLLPSA